VKFSSVVFIQIFILKNANPSINEIYVENDFFPLPSKFEMEAPSHHSIHYYGKEEALGNAPSRHRHCHKKKGTKGHGCSRHARLENLPRG
jgi:hypothetical protein